MIVATAGHIDHGKTLLIRALTGVDTDRLPEEKARGMTIDLGFAFMPVDSGGEAIGFIDAPGHERFIRNMLCGVAAVDFVLLVIAADDGPMPQTRAHLEILDLLEIGSGAVVLTKIDRVDRARIAAVREEIASLLAGTSLSHAPIFEVSAPSGLGIADLGNHLVKVAGALPPRRACGNFRLPVDRSFTLAGTGLVVTGTAVSGELAAGAPVETLEAGLSPRARSIHAQNAPAERCRAGQRCAVNLAGPGLAIGAIARGDWIVAPGTAPPASRIDVRIRVLARELRPLAHWTPVHVHLGTADVPGRIATLEGQCIEPGARALAQLVLDRPVGAVHGDRFIVRDQSSQRTIGGGRVIDIFPPARGRAKPERLAYLAAVENADHAVALRAALDLLPGGLDLSRFRANRNLTPEEAAALFAAAEVAVVATAPGPIGFSAARWRTLQATVVESLSEWHRRWPDTVGPSADRLLEGSEPRLARETVLAIADALAREGVVVKSGMGVRLPSHRPRPDPAQEALWRRVERALLTQGPRPPTVHDIAVAIGEDARTVEACLERAARHGRVTKVSPKRYFTFSALHRLASIAESLARQSPRGVVGAAAFRDRSGIGRNLTIEVLEFFDRVRFTRRVGDVRRVLRRPDDLFPVDNELTHRP